MKFQVCVISAVYLFCISFITPVMPLQCYECRAEMNKNISCENAVHLVPYQNCTENFYCLTSIETAGNISTINRYCAPPSTCNVVNANSTKINQFGLPVVQTKVTLCELCNNDFCNSANMLNTLSMYTGLTFMTLLALVLNY